MLWTECLYHPSNSLVESLTYIVAVFKGEAAKDIIKAKCDHRVGGPRSKKD